MGASSKERLFFINRQNIFTVNKNEKKSSPYCLPHSLPQPYMLPKSPIVWFLTMQIPTISCWRLGAKSPLVHRHISSTTTVPVDVTDVTALVSHIIGATTYPIELCDLNADGTINVTDVTTLITHLLK